ncbi:MAG: BatD family protein [Bacteroidales bacterium]|nr:BatD family protein [Bacteroidales bacterium]
MNTRKAYIIICISLLFVWLQSPIAAQTQNKSFKPTCEVRAPKQVAKGELFTYTIITNAKTDVNDPDFGPFMVNGQASNASSAVKVENGKRYTKTRRETIFYLVADTVGTFTIPANNITVGDKKMPLKSVTIEVLPSTPNNEPAGLTIFYSDTFYDDGDLSTYDIVEDYHPEPVPVPRHRNPHQLRNVLLYVLLGLFALFVVVMLVVTYKPMKDHFHASSQDDEQPPMPMEE